jgi:hypothetical protein
METTTAYSRYPVWIVLLSNLNTFLIYTSGLFILWMAGWLAAALYFIYLSAIEIRLLSRHCVNCAYYGSVCGFGRGWISALFFKKGDAAKFCEKEFTWKDMIPDLLVSLIPVIAGIVLLILKFNLLVLGAIGLIILLNTAGNSYIRGSLTCKYCKQGEIGCKALELFSQGKNMK